MEIEYVFYINGNLNFISILNIYILYIYIRWVMLKITKEDIIII